MLTKQEMFDRAWRGLKAQGWVRAYDKETSRCEYLTSDGLRCAWGHVDPDGTAKPVAKGRSVFGLKEDDVGLAADLSWNLVDFGHRLQMAHDNAPDDGLEARLREFAAAQGLTIPKEAL